MKIGDRVVVSSRYLNEFNGMAGVITSILDKQFHIEVSFDEEWSVDGDKVFPKKELIKIKL